MNTYTLEISNEKMERLKQLFLNDETAPIFYEPKNTDSYNTLRQVFNRRFDFMPSLIFQPYTTEHVATAVQFFSNNDIQFTVKSGGHDHEGECVATGKVLIDFAKMNQTKTNLEDYPTTEEKIKQIQIQPGAKFKNIKEELDKAHLGIPHGTCQSVAIAGYVMGGGWGPWTRKYGMGCERLKGATIVLGDGTVRYLGSSAFYNSDKVTESQTEEADRKLLWAIRGGGGLSYGIVTQFFFEPFELPKIAFSFQIHHDTLPELEHIKASAVIEAWEEITKPNKYPQLIGTNLKVVAKGVENKEDISEDAILDWTMNGHFGGNRIELIEMVVEWIKFVAKLHQKDQDLASNSNDGLLENLVEGIKNKFDEAANSSTVLAFIKGEANGYPYTFEAWDRYSAVAKKNGLSLETDCPAPHKITSRMPTEDWNCASRNQLVRSLQSTLLNGIENTNISSYITLGAIQGEFYKTNEAKIISAEKNAFPYQARPFTIQYQTWWDMPTENKDGECVLGKCVAEKVIPTREYVNRALDWMEECRDYQIDETDGAFISFKDNSVPTKNYFSQNYDALIAIKEAYSEDEKFLFRSRKTII